MNLTDEHMAELAPARCCWYRGDDGTGSGFTVGKNKKTTVLDLIVFDKIILYYESIK
jgi:hypothetical protein